MATCNAWLLFTNMVAMCHESTKDSAVFDASMLNIQLESRGGGKGWLLGNRGYALTPVMMTPDKMTSNAKRKYQRHTKTRNAIERSFGVLKQRFRCLDFSCGAMLFSPS